jgi:hypothetical protein
MKNILISSTILAISLVAGEIPQISATQYNNTLSLQIKNLEKDDIKAIKINGEDVSEKIEKMIKDESAEVKEEDGNYLLQIPYKKESKTISLSLSSNNELKTKVHQINVKNRALLSGKTRVYGTVEYKIPNCYWFGCWKPASQAYIDVEPVYSYHGESKTGMQSASFSTDRNGKFDKSIEGCGKYIITASYKGMSQSEEYTPWGCNWWRMNDDKWNFYLK